jgi:hypothetical protein
LQAMIDVPGAAVPISAQIARARATNKHTRYDTVLVPLPNAQGMYVAMH